MWQIQDELNFFQNALHGGFAGARDIFYEIDNKFLAYIPKNYPKNVPTLQTRNVLIGSFTESWCQKLLEDFARTWGLFAVSGAICEELGLGKNSRADLALCRTNEISQKAENIKMLFEIKMSVVNNYEMQGDTDFNGADFKIKLIGGIKSHKALPSLTRSDSVLKAIGKAINIRVSAPEARQIPIVIFGNTHTSEAYLSKIDDLAKFGVLQRVINLNPDLVASSPRGFFATPRDFAELCEILDSLLDEDLHFFAAMMDKSELGQIIKKSAKNEIDEVQIANNFLKMLEG